MVFFTTLLQTYPRATIIVLAVLISLVISIVNFFVLDKEKMRHIKARQKELQKQIREHQKAGNREKVMELNKELMAYIPETFKHTMKPMLITIIPLLILFYFIRHEFDATAIAGTWFWYYLVAGLISSLIFRKLFKLP